MTFRYGFLHAACFLMFAAAGCAAAPGGQASKPALFVEIVSSGQQCFPASATWTAFWISSGEELRQHVSKCRANRIGTGIGKMPAVDFHRFGVLMLEMGQRNTAGYGFETEGITAHVAGNTAVVKLGLRFPEPGGAVAQVLTSPWIMLKLPLGAYDGVRVVDPDDRLLAGIEF